CSMKLPFHLRTASSKRFEHQTGLSCSFQKIDAVSVISYKTAFVNRKRASCPLLSSVVYF
ncbi:hypothetical protein, partial [Hydrogenimonas sp.]